MTRLVTRTTPASSLNPDPPRRAVTWRSFLLGSLIVALTSVWVPYQHVVPGPGIEGQYLPLIGFFAVGVMILINALLLRWSPQRRFQPGEFATVLAMVLVACGVINIGLFRQLPGNLTGLWYVGGTENTDYARVLDAMNLPEWMFPTMESDTAARRAQDPVVWDFINRTPITDRGFVGQWFAVPWRAWLTPALTWGAFVACLWGACLCLVIIFRRQWVENERLPFPIAHVYLSLIEPPEAGRAFNRVVRSRALWVAFAAVYAVVMFNGFHVYDPKHFPEIPLTYDFNTLFTNQPWSFTSWGLKKQTISFTLVAVCLFITTQISFSLWFFFLATQGVRMFLGAQYQRELTGGMETDQTLGAFLAYGVAMVYIARHHLMLVLRQMLRGARAGEARGRYMPYVVVGWALVAFVGGMALWLHLAGATIAGALFISIWLVFALLALARIVAETGLVWVVFTLSIHRWFIYALQDLPKAIAFRVTTTNFFHGALQSGIFLQDLGHSLAPHATNSLRIADSASYENESNWRRAAPLLLCMVAAIVIGYVVAGSSMLHMQYNHAVTLDRTQAPPNDWGTMGMPRWHVLYPTAEFAPPRTGPAETHSRLGFFSAGAGITALCSFLRLRYTWWPLHPVGFLLVYGWGINNIWFSIFLGWLVKLLIVRFGGIPMLRASRPLFIGMILGEAGAKLTWVGINFVLLSMGAEIRIV